MLTASSRTRQERPTWTVKPIEPRASSNDRVEGRTEWRYALPMLTASSRTRQERPTWTVKPIEPRVSSNDRFEWSAA